MKQILCFGDSNTYGLIPGTTDRYDWGTRWTSILSEAMKEKGYHVIEEGLCGRTTVFDDPLRDGRRGTELLPVLLESHKPIDTVILMLGTNDCKTIFDASPQVIGKGIERLLEQIRRSDPGIKVLLISPIELGERVWQEGFDPEFSQSSITVSRSLPAVYHKIAEKNDIYFMAASQYAEPSKVDQEHLDEKGHAALANAIIRKINEVKPA